MSKRLARFARSSPGGRLTGFVSLILLGLALQAAGAQPEKPARTAMILDLDGVVGPATASYVTRGLHKAADQGAPLVILRMDTPGGLDTSMREIIQAILASPVPVVGYVAPSGARAASAGTYILYACHVAAMAPGTNLGAATPVQLGGGGIIPGIGGGGDDQQKPGDEAAKSSKDNAAPEPATAEGRKALNDAIAYIRSLAELRGRNVDWAEKAVREAASLTASSAVAMNVADLMADDVSDLMKKLDGRMVKLGSGTVTLHTEGMASEVLEPDWRTDFLRTITNPEHRASAARDRRLRHPVRVLQSGLGRAGHDRRRSA